MRRRDPARDSAGRRQVARDLNRVFDLGVWLITGCVSRQYAVPGETAFLPLSLSPNHLLRPLGVVVVFDISAGCGVGA